MASICGPHSLRVSQPKGLHFHQSGAVFGAMSTMLGYVEYGTDVTVAVRKEEPLSRYSLSLPVVGHQELSAHGKHWLSDENQGLIVSPDDTQDLEISGNCRKVHVAISRSAIHHVLETMLRRPVDAPIVFHPEMDATTGDQASWWRMVKFLIGELGRTSPELVRLYMSSEFEITLLKTLLLSQPNNYSCSLADALERTTPHYVAKARNFIHENARDPITLDDIERAAGVLRPKLFEGFKQYLGCPPMGYLRKYRLESVRDELSSSKQVRSVSVTATGWGVTHLGRFSIEYKEMFGESPSDTLKRGRQLLASKAGRN
jgi:AraC-like DNA-binding protein